MSSRRTFLKTAGAVTAGIAGAATASTSVDKSATVKKYSGPHDMRPTSPFYRCKIPIDRKLWASNWTTVP